MTNEEDTRCTWCAVHGCERCALHGPPPTGAGWLRVPQPRARRSSARQLDAFTGRDVRGVAPQLDLFVSGREGARGAQ